MSSFQKKEVHSNTIWRYYFSAEKEGISLLLVLSSNTAVKCSYLQALELKQPGQRHWHWSHSILKVMGICRRAGCTVQTLCGAGLWPEKVMGNCLVTFFMMEKRLKVLSPDQIFISGGRGVLPGQNRIFWPRWTKNSHSLACSYISHALCVWRLHGTT